MNLLLVCNRTVRKPFEDMLKTVNDCTLLGTETAIRHNFSDIICNKYNPHIVMLVRGVVVSQKPDLKNIIPEIRAKRPSIRFIYVYGDISDQDEFEKTYSFLTENNIFDIVVGQKTDVEFAEIIGNPMTKEQLEQAINAENTAEEQPEAEEIQEEKQTEQVEKIPVTISSLTAQQDFDIMTVVNIVENNEATEIKNISIGVTELLHHNGCTHTAFELVSMLNAKKKSACIVIFDNETYRNLAKFHGLVGDKLLENGFKLKNLNIYPCEKLAEVSEQYNYIVCDIGYLKDDLKPVFSEMHIKIMLCSSAEWDIDFLLKYINFSSDGYIRDINYCFYPISQAKFVQYNKQMIKGNCRAYRLRTSVDWISPCTENQNVYTAILKKYTNIIPKKKGILEKILRKDK